MLTVCCWKWKRADGSDLFGPEYVNRLRAALDLHLSLPHELVCVTDDPTGVDARVRLVDLPTTLSQTPRCRRRMQVFSKDFARQLGDRILSIDLDVVLVGDITPIVDRREPIVCWRVGYAQVFSGSFHLMDAGHLDGLWRAFESDPEGYPRRVCPRERVPSDQAMLNAYLRGDDVPHWTEADGFVTYFGAGYERLEHLGLGMRHTTLPAGARVVVMGSADLAELEAGRDPWMREHWGNLPAEAACFSA